MKFTISREALVEALSYIRGTLSNSKIPILQNALLSIKGNRLTLGSHNTYACMTYAVECEASGDGATTVPLEAMHQIVSGAPKGETISCSTTDARITISWKKSRYTLDTLSASDFPTMYERPDAPKVEMSAEEIAQLLERPSAVIDGADERPLYSGVFIHELDGALASIASDGSRVLCFRTTFAANDLAPIMVSKLSALEIAKIGAGELSWTDSLLYVDAGHKTFATKLVDCKYGDYLKKIPADTSPYLEFDRIEFLQAIERMATVAVGSSIVRLSWKGKPKEAIAEFAKDGDGREEITCTGNAPKGFVGIPAGRLAELISALNGEKIRLHIESEGVPIRIVDLSEPSAIVVQCPLVIGAGAQEEAA